MDEWICGTRRTIDNVLGEEIAVIRTLLRSIRSW